jgi:hypothetical protein
MKYCTLVMRRQIRKLSSLLYLVTVLKNRLTKLTYVLKYFESLHYTNFLFGIYAG